MAIEIDGAMHDSDEALARDEMRDGYFARLGIATYRVPASEVYRDADAVADGVRLLVAEILGK